MAEQADEVVEGQENDQVADVSDATEGDTDFDSGFSGDRPTDVSAPADEPGNESETESTEGAGTPEPKYVQVTEEEWQRVLAQSTEIEKIKADSTRKLDTAFGKLGSVEQRLAQLQGATPAGIAVDVDDTIVADLAAEFPELGKHALAAFKAFAGKLKGTAPAASSFGEAQVAPLITAATQQLQRDVLSIKHEDWEEVVGLPGSDGVIPDTDYRKWLAKQPAEYQASIGGSWDARVVAKSIDKFQSEAKAAANTAGKTPSGTPAPSARRTRLEQAATPRGEGGRPTGRTEDDEFNAGFKTG